MKFFLVLTALFTSLSVMANSKVSINVTLNPAGSFQATSEKINATVTKKKDGTVTADKISIPVQSLHTGIDLRDEHLWKHLNSTKYPKAIVSDIKGKNGKASGMLEIAGAKKPIDITYEEKGSNLIAKFSVKTSNFGLPTAEYMGVGVDDNVSGEVSLPFKSL